MKDKRSYADRKEYFRQHQKRWRATPRGKQSTRSTWRKHSLKTNFKRSDTRQRLNAGEKRSVFRSFAAYFARHDPVSVVPYAYLLDPTFKVCMNGVRRTEWLSEPLPTWIDEFGNTKGGGKWTGADFV